MATTTDRRRPSPVWVFAGSLALFFAVLAFLAVQVRAGGDPALGPAKPAATAEVRRAEPRRVIVRRIILRRVIVTDPPPAPVAPAAAPAPAPAAAAPAPVVRTAAPVVRAPAPAPAAPVPAPVTTGSS